jgi:WD40 repeat protein
MKTDLWDRKLERHTDWVRDVAFSPDGATIVSGSWDKTVRVWNVRTGVCEETLQGDDRVDYVAVSPDGATIMSGSFENTVRFWDLRTGRPLMQWKK